VFASIPAQNAILKTGFIQYALQFAEQLSLVEQILKQVGLVNAEGVILDEAFQRQVGYQRQIQETTNISEDINKGISRTIAEIVVMTDVVAKQPIKYFSEDMNISEVVSKQVGFWKIFTEQTTLQEQVSKAIYKSFDEAMLLVEMFQKQWQVVRTFTNTIRVVEAIGLGEGGIYSLIDAIKELLKYVK